MRCSWPTVISSPHKLDTIHHFAIDDALRLSLERDSSRGRPDWSIGGSVADAEMESQAPPAEAPAKPERATSSESRPDEYHGMTDAIPGICDRDRSSISDQSHFSVDLSVR